MYVTEMIFISNGPRYFSLREVSTRSVFPTTLKVLRMLTWLKIAWTKIELYVFRRV